jgi:hypothetical protein
VAGAALLRPSANCGDAHCAGDATAGRARLSAVRPIIGSDPLVLLGGTSEGAEDDIATYFELRERQRMAMASGCR